MWNWLACGWRSVMKWKPRTEGASAEPLSACKLARSPLNIHDDTELLADPHRVKCDEGIAGRGIASGCTVIQDLPPVSRSER